MARVQLQPSPFDRLDPVAQVVRWWTSQMAAMLANGPRNEVHSGALDQSKKRLPRRIVIVLTGTDGFTARTRLPKGQASTHLKAIELRLPDLAPVDPLNLVISTTAVSRNEDGGTTYEIAMARKARLDELEAIAKRKGAQSVAFKVESSASVVLQSPRALSRASAGLVMDSAIIMATLASAVAAVSAWTIQVEKNTQALAEEERSLRRAAVATEASRSAGEISRQLVERGILTRRGSAALEALATLNSATPDETWWTRIRWSPGEVAITGQSPNATAAINALSSSAKGWSVELAGPLNSAQADGVQLFEILAKPRGAQPR